MTTVNMMGAPGADYYVNNNTYIANAAGYIANVATNDIAGLIAGGARISPVRTDWLGPIVPATASGTVTVANVAATSGALTIAAQPDCIRPLLTVLAPGAAAITAGTLAVVYNNQNGVAVTDTFSLITGS